MSFGCEKYHRKMFLKNRRNARRLPIVSSCVLHCFGWGGGWTNKLCCIKNIHAINNIFNCVISLGSTVASFVYLIFNLPMTFSWNRYSTVAAASMPPHQKHCHKIITTRIIFLLFIIQATCPHDLVLHPNTRGAQHRKQTQTSTKNGFLQRIPLTKRVAPVFRRLL